MGMLYIISPIDLVPDPVFGFGIIDDIILVLYIVNNVWSNIEKYMEYKGIYNNDNESTNNNKIIEDVEYEINDDE